MRNSCRYCGAQARLRLVGGIAVCDDCANSPLCDRCGHPRGDHGQVFVRGVSPRCSHRSLDFQSLTRSDCPCTGFRPVAGALSEASFAAPDPLPLQARLRVVRRERG